MPTTGVNGLSGGVVLGTVCEIFDSRVLRFKVEAWYNALAEVYVVELCFTLRFHSITGKGL